MEENNTSKVWTKKRGRPKSPALELFRKLYPEHTSRQSINNKRHMAALVKAAMQLDLLDERCRDKQTGKRLETKLAIVGRLFDDYKFWATDKGRQWLTDNWPFVVEWSTKQIAEWAKEIKGNQP